MTQSFQQKFALATKFSVISLSALLMACANQTSDNTTQTGQSATAAAASPASQRNAREQTIWVAADKLPCTGVGRQTCLQIQTVSDAARNQDAPNPGAWTYFYQSIDGFTHKPGVESKLRVRVTEQDPARTPSDASTLRYQVAELLEENNKNSASHNMDEEMMEELESEWVVTRIGDMPIEEMDPSKVPSLEFMIEDQRFFGNDGCNNIAGEIDVSNNSALRFGRTQNTRQLCSNMEVPSRLTSRLQNVTRFELAGVTLQLFDGDDKSLLTLKREAK